MTRVRDSQRARLYAWEHRYNAAECRRFESVDEVTAYIRPIWRGERGRYGRAKSRVPDVHPGGWGQHSALACASSHTISLPRWSRYEWVILHELAHLLTNSRRRGIPAHGPRFVGVLIGLLARHAGYDAAELQASAAESGVEVDARSIGSVPVAAQTLSARLDRLLPVGYMQAAFALDVSYRAINGAALTLIRAGRARWRGRVLVAVAQS